MIIQNKKGFLLRDFVVVSIIFGMIVGLFILSVADISQNYNNNQMINPTFAAHYSQLQNNLQKLDISNKAVQGSGGGLNLIGTFNVAFNSVFTVIVMVWDSLAIYTGMSLNFADDFTGFDRNTMLLFGGGIIAIITTYLIFIWLSSVSRGKI
jgi:hypothetical protein